MQEKQDGWCKVMEVTGCEDFLQQIPLCGRWRDLPPEVGLAIRLVDAPEEGDSESLAEAIEAVPQLAKLVLRQMNSALYAPLMPVTDVQSAVTGLGYEVIRNFIAGYITDFLLGGQRHDRPAFHEREYWRHALATCIAADMLGQKVGFEDRFRLFTYGLLHDSGFVVLEACFPHLLDAIHEKVAEGVPLIVAEKAVLSGATHGDVGGWLCRRWGLDETAWMVVQYHHTPLLLVNPCQELLLLYLGNIVGTQVYENSMQLHFGESPADERVLAMLGLTGADIAAASAAIHDELARFEQMIVLP